MNRHVMMEMKCILSNQWKYVRDCCYLKYTLVSMKIPSSVQKKIHILLCLPLSWTFCLYFIEWMKMKIIRINADEDEISALNEMKKFIFHIISFLYLIKNVITVSALEAIFCFILLFLFWFHKTKRVLCMLNGCIMRNKDLKRRQFYLL